MTGLTYLIAAIRGEQWRPIVTKVTRRKTQFDEIKMPTRPPPRLTTDTQATRNRNVYFCKLKISSLFTHLQIFYFLNTPMKVLWCREQRVRFREKVFWPIEIAALKESQTKIFKKEKAESAFKLNRNNRLWLFKDWIGHKKNRHWIFPGYLKIS